MVADLASFAAIFSCICVCISSMLLPLRISSMLMPQSASFISAILSRRAFCCSGVIIGEPGAGFASGAALAGGAVICALIVIDIAAIAAPRRMRLMGAP